jgi:hypothetical protein
MIDVMTWQEMGSGKTYGKLVVPALKGTRNARTQLANLLKRVGQTRLQIGDILAGAGQLASQAPVLSLEVRHGF